jgi:tRNA(Ile)-lysidine synthase
MKVTFINKVRRTIEHYGMLDRGDRICVAVSGGPDSVALLQLLRLFADDYRLHLVAAHLNHGIRSSESHRDETFVRELCRSMNVPVRTGYVSVYSIKNKDGGSLEDICRRERFRYLKEVSREEGLNKIALGHNLNDQAETIIMRFLRGSGITGMKGILPIRDNIYVRPLLEVTREEILTFLECEGANYVTDSSNLENIYLRNRIRNRLIPELQDYYNARLVDNLGRMAHVLRMEDDFIEEATENVLKDWNISGNENIITIYIPQFRSVHIALQKRIIKLLLERMTLKSKGIGYLHVGAVMELIAGEKPNGFFLFRYLLNVNMTNW